MLRKGAKPMFLFNTGMKFRHSSNSLHGIGEKGSATIVFVMHTLA
jgi:hypothetical protein